MTEIEKLKHRIDLKFQYITLLGEKIDETRDEIQELQDQLAELEKIKPCHICGVTGLIHHDYCSGSNT